MALIHNVKSPAWQVYKPKRDMPPSGQTISLCIFIDSDLSQYNEVWAVVGTWNEVFGTVPCEWLDVTGVTADLECS